MNGLEHIRQAFEAASSAGRAALMPYFTLGYPAPQASAEIVEAIARSGADLIELGVPFSDPLADGPTIQHSTQTALEQGMNVHGCLEIVTRLRQRGVRQPLLLMGYYNPILAYGVAGFVADAARAGADGFIVPDLPVEEAGELEAACRLTRLRPGISSGAHLHHRARGKGGCPFQRFHLPGVHHRGHRGAPGAAHPSAGFHPTRAPAHPPAAGCGFWHFHRRAGRRGRPPGGWRHHRISFDQSRE